MPSRNKLTTLRRRAGQLGGAATREKYGVTHYQSIGSLGGQATMERHADEYAALRQRGGQTTRRRYGRQHFKDLARKSAETRQAATAKRDTVIVEMLADGWRIPTIIQLTFDDLPDLKKYLRNGLGKYLKTERPDSDSPYLFVSKSGKPLTLANTYKVMRAKQTE
ncbi:Glucose starvation-inducible protein B [Thermoflexales bacterium]|nr:Glucose starvation-inducible protein B [Thermoflexales bacterium]